MESSRAQESLTMALRGQSTACRPANTGAGAAVAVCGFGASPGPCWGEGRPPEPAGGSPSAFTPPLQLPAPTGARVSRRMSSDSAAGVARGCPVMPVTASGCQDASVGQWLLAGDGHISVLPATHVENGPSASEGREHARGSVRRGRLLAAWRGGFQGNDFSCLWRKREKGSCVRQTRGAREHKAF